MRATVIESAEQGLGTVRLEDGREIAFGPHVCVEGFAVAGTSVEVGVATSTRTGREYVDWMTVPDVWERVGEAPFVVVGHAVWMPRDPDVWITGPALEPASGVRTGYATLERRIGLRRSTLGKYEEIMRIASHRADALAPDDVTRVCELLQHEVELLEWSIREEPQDARDARREVMVLRTAIADLKGVGRLPRVIERLFRR